MAGNAGKAWLLAGGDPSAVDTLLGLRRATAASLLMFALPGSAYLYQGEELGLQEVGNIPDADRQDPSFFRNPGVDVGRDGCRVPLPWTDQSTSFGFGTGGSHLPQPEWFAGTSVAAQEPLQDSTLSMYRKALALRSQLQAGEELEWLATGRPDVLAFRRPNGWTSVTNFGEEPFQLLAGSVLVTSVPLDAGLLPGCATAWLQA